MKEKYYANRELSWLKFNERVIEEAYDETVPLAERLSFVEIFQSNLDEFFMVRVGSLMTQNELHKDLRENKTNMTAAEQITAISKEVRKLTKRKDKVYHELMNKLKVCGLEVVDFDNISKEDEKYLEVYFNKRIKPLISPQVVGKRQPFPFLKNKEIYCVVELDHKGDKSKIGIIPCHNGLFKRLIQLDSDAHKYVFVEDLIMHFASKIFEYYKVYGASLVRVLRSADIDTEDGLYDMYEEEIAHETFDYREAMTNLINQRTRQDVVRLEFSKKLDNEFILKLCKYLDITKEQAYIVDAPLDLSFVYNFQDTIRNGHPDFFYKPRVPQISKSVDEERSMIEQINEKDILLSYPFESMKPFLDLLDQASKDPAVVSMKMTLYRVAKYSKITEMLIHAAENGKEVVVLVELRARFDEENNIEWSKRMEDAGVRIIYGLDNLKVHSKLCLITRMEDNQISYITQIGTGNYNEKTAKLYTDLCLMTANKEIGEEAGEVFNALSLGTCVDHTEHLMVAPKCLRNKIIDLIEEEIQKAKAGQKAYIGCKMNSLTDRKLIDKLVEASEAGVKIDLVVRGISCLIPGIKGKTDHIHIYSIVGRFLEHSRIYIFGANANDRKMYISSADFMTRNTTRRVEVAAPIYDEDLKERIFKMFKTLTKDNCKVRVLHANGNYTKRTPGEGKKKLNAQEYFYAQAYGEVE